MRFSNLATSLLSVVSLTAASSLNTRANKSAAAPSVCNGRAEYCSRIYSNVSQIGSHDSAFVGELPTENQLWSVADQLKNGIRFLTAQTHKNVFGQLDACHTSCWEEDAGSVSGYLTTIKTFLDNNPDEVVTVLLTNGDNLGMDKFDAEFTKSGVKKYVYTPPSTNLAIDKWPTFGDMIASGQRLVVFMDYGADPTHYPYILDEFAYMFETPFDTTDPNFAQCKVDRPANANPDGRMYLVNHNLDIDLLHNGDILIPDHPDVAKTNAATGNPSSIMNQSNLCNDIYKRYPRVVILDYVDAGDWKTAELMMNGLS